MSPKSKKTVPFEVDGKTYQLCFSINALTEFEKISGLKGMQIAEIFGDKGENFAFERLRQVFWAGLTDCVEGITMRQAGQILDGLGVQEVGPLIGEALKKAFADMKMADSPAPAGNVGNDPAAAIG